MTIKERLPIHKQAYPYFLLTLGLLFGLGIAIDWDIGFKAKLETEKSGWDIAASIGSLLAGFGTVGLLVFGWIKGSVWVNQIKSEKRLNIIIEASDELIKASNYFENIVKIEFLDRNSGLHSFTNHKGLSTSEVTKAINTVEGSLNTLRSLLKKDITLGPKVKELQKHLEKLDKRYHSGNILIRGCDVLMGSALFSEKAKKFHMKLIPYLLDGEWDDEN
ncbi:hypothetical protein EBI00_02445 [Marinomonas hwangdonensis]|uniref:Uncharacterized protein n=1 Tax=Marinomonas hwangdonensis TaxID=1053647 RepID=A0A3M8QAA7_9GAMM|nr:hypothetical protein [Marinomonas hwangdonensis]RNF52979.1 hypothetical protein EBI00_02445 [Marinomonas hwangdonensis]